MEAKNIMNDIAAKPPLALRAGLWGAQGLVGAMFLMGGVMKLTTPLDKLAQMMPWTGEVDPMLVYATGVFDALGGIGILLPALTRIMPRLTVYAAIGCVALQVCALVFHISRGEGAMMGPINVVLGALAAFVAWGRATAAPIQPR